MSDKIDVKEFLKKEIRPPADELLKAHDGQTEKLKQLLFVLADDEEKKNERMLKLHVKELQALLGELSNHLSRTSRLLGKIEDLEPDDSFMANHAEVEKITGELSELERKINKNYGLAKTQLDKAEKVLEADEADTSSDEVVQEWAVMETWMRTHLAIAKDRVDKIEAIQSDAKQAVDKRDAKALEEAGKASAALVDAKPDLQKIVDDYEEANKDRDTEKLTKEQQDQFKRDRNTFDKMAQEIAALNANVIAADVAIEGLEIEPIDAKKAANVLKIPSSHEAKLKKALELDGAALVKAFDALAKEAKLDTTGKDMVAALKKAKLL